MKEFTGNEPDDSEGGETGTGDDAGSVAAGEPGQDRSNEDGDPPPESAEEDISEAGKGEDESSSGATDGAAELMTQNRINPAVVAGTGGSDGRIVTADVGVCLGAGKRLTARKPIEDASTAEIRKFAAQRSALEIHPDANEATAVQRPRATWDGDRIEVADEASPAPAAEAATVRSSAAPEGMDLGKAWYPIRIPPDPRGGTDRILPVGIDRGKRLIERGVQSEIRAPYLDVPKNAVERRDYREDPDDIRSMLQTVFVPSHPFPILKGPCVKDGHGEAIAARTTVWTPSRKAGG